MTSEQFVSLISEPVEIPPELATDVPGLAEAFKRAAITAYNVNGCLETRFHVLSGQTLYLIDKPAELAEDLIYQVVRKFCAIVDGTLVAIVGEASVSIVSGKLGSQTPEDMQRKIDQAKRDVIAGTGSDTLHVLQVAMQTTLSAPYKQHHYCSIDRLGDDWTVLAGESMAGRMFSFERVLKRVE